MEDRKFITKQEFKYDYLSLKARAWISDEAHKNKREFWQEIAETINAIVEEKE